MVENATIARPRRDYYAFRRLSTRLNVHYHSNFNDGNAPIARSRRDYYAFKRFSTRLSCITATNEATLQIRKTRQMRVQDAITMRSNDSRGRRNNLHEIWFVLKMLFRHTSPCSTLAGAWRESDFFNAAIHLPRTVATLSGCHGDMSRREIAVASWMAYVTAGREKNNKVKRRWTMLEHFGVFNIRC